jgi:hypothetical protein
MTVADYAPGEVVRLGEQIYHEQLQAELEPGNIGRVLVIDITTGNYEFQDNKNTPAAGERLRERNPDAVLYALRIGYPAVSKRGSWPIKR